jgi:DNA-binding transcriptional MerR regulator
MSVSALSVYGADAGAFGPLMTAKPRRKQTKYETWLDAPWSQAPDVGSVDLDRFLTRQELVAATQERLTNPIDKSTIVHWEQAGVLPRPIRRHRGGAPRALYPPGAMYFIGVARWLQSEGLSLREIRQWLRALATNEKNAGAALDERGTRARSARSALMLMARSEEQFRHLPPGTIRGVSIRFTDEQGHVITGWEETRTDFELTGIAGSREPPSVEAS